MAKRIQFAEAGAVTTSRMSPGQTVKEGDILMYNPAGELVKGNDTASCIFAGLAFGDYHTGTGEHAEVVFITHGFADFPTTINLGANVLGKDVNIQDEDGENVDVDGSTTNDIKVGRIVKRHGNKSCRVAFGRG